MFLLLTKCHVGEQELSKLLMGVENGVTTFETV